MLSDLRFALRQLNKAPMFTLIAVLMLALGIGASTACFTFLNTFFLRPPPFPNPAELVSFHTTDERSPGLMLMSYPNFRDYRDRSDVFSATSTYFGFGTRLTDGERDTNIYGHLVSGSYFDLLGITPQRGRLIMPTDDQGETPAAVIVVSHRYWQERMGAAENVVGSSLVLNGNAFTIVGVAPEGFRGVPLFDNPDFWAPISSYRLVLNPTALDFFTSRRSVTVPAFGRLKPGVTLEQAQAALQGIAADLAKAYPADNGGRALRLLPLAQSRINPNMRSDLLKAGNLLLGLSALILLVACANLANLLLARAGARRREIALRIALGASRAQVVRQLALEHLVLAVLGGAAGVLLANWLCDLLWALRPRGYPASATVEIDAAVLGFAVLITAATGLLFGLIPALSAAKVDLISVLKRDLAGPKLGTFSFRHVLVAGQVALSVVALVIAGLFLRSLEKANSVDLGWDGNGLALFSLFVGNRNLGHEGTIQYYERALAHVRTIPGVLDASYSSRPYLTGVNPQRTVRPQGEDITLRERGQLMSYACIAPGYLRFMGIRLLAGREFTEHDNDQHPWVAVVNETFAKRFFPNTDAVGQIVKLFNTDRPMQIVGVVEDIRDVDLQAPPAPFVYLALRQIYHPQNVFHVRVAGDPDAMMPTLQRELKVFDPSVETGTYSITEILRYTLWGPRTGAMLMTTFGLIALTLSALGIYAVMAHAVAQRTREIGIRIAIGAQTHAIRRLILGRGLIVTLAGVVAGLAIAGFITRFVRNFLFETTPTDLLTFLLVPLVLLGVALLACWLPARRAARTDPMVSLRSE